MIDHIHIGDVFYNGWASPEGPYRVFLVVGFAGPRYVKILYSDFRIGQMERSLIMSDPHFQRLGHEDIKDMTSKVLAPYETMIGRG